jgi:hypothetical protein
MSKCDSTIASSSVPNRSRSPEGLLDCVPEEESIPEGADPADWPEGIVTAAGSMAVRREDYELTAADRLRQSLREEVARHFN